MNIDVIEKRKCSGCMACYNICPKKAILIDEKDGFFYPKIQNEICINCGLCKIVCPVLKKENEEKDKYKSKKENDTNNLLEVYACKNSDEKIRMKSSSGGVFTLLAEYILEQDGVIFGAKFNESLEVVHDYIEQIEDIDKFRGSKYLQSKMGNTYIKVKEFLDIGRKVLFTGTPCQIEGLLSYLRKDYDNLYTQDIICHGVPSPKVWRKYLEYKKEKNGEYPKKVNFRKKDILGWSKYQVSYTYSNKEENIHHDDDSYMKLFLRNFDLRKSCYECSFKEIYRKSDITIADFWGINEVNDKFNDEKGISAILIHSLKGRELFNKIKDKIEYTKANINDIIKHNSCICISTKYNEKREEFFEDLEKKDFEYIIQKYL